MCFERDASLLSGGGTTENIDSNHKQRQMSQIVILFFLCYMNYSSDIKCSDSVTSLSPTLL